MRAIKCGGLPLVTNEVLLSFQRLVKDVEDALDLINVSGGCALDSLGVEFDEPLSEAAVNSLTRKFMGNTNECASRKRDRYNNKMYSQQLDHNMDLDLIPGNEAIA